MDKQALPLDSIKVLEFSHMVMGPAAGVILADMGADVIKIEPVKGDATRHLPGSGAGYFLMYNRNKRSLCVNLKSEEGRDIVLGLIKDADVVIENFRPGTMGRLGFGYEVLSKLNPRLIYCSEKGFLAGPYEHRTALDEVAQMMGGLAYMTGPPGKPLRAGASVIDVQGGMFGALGIIAALHQRHATGKGQHLVTSLYENTVFLVGQHMAQQIAQNEPVRPMSIRTSAWAVYDIFQTHDDEKVFVAVVSDTQWRAFCQSFGLHEFLSDESLAGNGERVAARGRIIPVIQDLFLTLTKTELMRRLEDCGLPFAGIGTPADLFDEPHLLASGGLLDVTMQDGKSTRLPAIPLQMDGNRFGLRHDLPTCGQHTKEILKQAGMTDTEVEVLFKTGVVA